MKSAKLNDSEIIDLIIYGLEENNVEIKNNKILKVKDIVISYNKYCNFFKHKFDGKLDTFKRAACLLTAINQGNFSENAMTNASIAIDSAFKMCEKPYQYDFDNGFTFPEKLEEVEFKKIFENNMDIYNNNKSKLIESLITNNNASLNDFYINFKQFYDLALQLKYKNNQASKK